MMSVGLFFTSVLSHMSGKACYVKLHFLKIFFFSYLYCADCPYSAVNGSLHDDKISGYIIL